MATLKHPLAGGGPGPSPGPAAQAIPPTPTPTPTPMASVTGNDAGAALWALIKPYAAQETASQDMLATLVNDAIATAVRRVEIALPGIPAVKLDGAHPETENLVRNVALGLDTLIVGPAGSGKTYAVRQVAEKMGKPLFIATSLADTFEVKGFNNASGEFVETEVSRFAETENAILLLDEVDGYQAGPALCLNMLLSDRILVTAKGKLHVPASNVVIATANTWGLGATFDYVGRNRLDAAFLDRFVKMAWGYDEQFERQIAMAKSGLTDADVPRTIQDIRKNAMKAGLKAVITPRATTSYCKLRAAKVSHLSALQATVLAGLDNSQTEKVCAGVTGVRVCGVL